jgi:hypothetical protein
MKLAAVWSVPCPFVTRNIYSSLVGWIEKMYEKLTPTRTPIAITSAKTIMSPLPKAFAIYRAETETFQILQPDIGSDGTILRLKNWARPDIRTYTHATPLEREELTKWFRGQEWYVVPSTSDPKPIVLHKTIIHEQAYAWWFCRHMLVWSDYHVYGGRRGLTATEWKNCPSIPIIQFNSKLIYPRTNLAMYPRWSDTTPEALKAISQKGQTEFQVVGMNLADEFFDTSSLRIRTPPPQDDETSASETEGLYAPRAKVSYGPIQSPLTRKEACVAYTILGSTMLFLFGMYAFAAVAAFGN